MITKDKQRARLLDAWRELAESQQLTLIQFAEFLQAQQKESEEPVSQKPLNLPIPENESAVKALKRLKRNYPMIEADMGLLDEASRLLMAKVTGTPDLEVIEQLEALFAGRYEGWMEKQAGGS
jgi:hypothetical protein